MNKPSKSTTSNPPHMTGPSSPLTGQGGDAAMQLISVPIRQIGLDPNRPRRPTDGPEHDFMVASISAVGVNTPPLVYKPDPANPRYVLLSGERRYNACRALGYKEMPVIAVQVADNPAAGLIENLLSDDLPALDEAMWLKQAKVELRCTDDHLAKVLGRSRSTITKMLGVADLPMSLQDAIRELPSSPPLDHLIQLSQCGDTEQQQKLFEQIKGGATQAELRDARKGSSEKGKASDDPKVPDLKRVVARLLKLEENEGSINAASSLTSEEIKEFRRCIRLLQNLISKSKGKPSAAASTNEAVGDAPAMMH